MDLSLIVIGNNQRRSKHALSYSSFLRLGCEVKEQIALKPYGITDDLILKNNYFLPVDFEMRLKYFELCVRKSVDTLLTEKG